MSGQQPLHSPTHQEHWPWEELLSHLRNLSTLWLSVEHDKTSVTTFSCALGTRLAFAKPTFYHTSVATHNSLSSHSYHINMLRGICNSAQKLANFYSLVCMCATEVGGRGGGHQRWLQHKTAGSGHGVAGLNLPPGNPFRGQVCLLKERQSSSFGFCEAAVQDIPTKKLTIRLS